MTIISYHWSSWGVVLFFSSLFSSVAVMPLHCWWCAVTASLPFALSFYTHFCLVHTWDRDNMLQHYILYLLLNVDEFALLSVVVAFSLFHAKDKKELFSLSRIDYNVIQSDRALTIRFHIHVLVSVCKTEAREHRQVRRREESGCV